MDKDFRVEFSSCPACGSDQQFLKELGKELVERGLARPDFAQRYEMRTGVIADQNKTVLIPIGIKLPGYHIVTDICMNCGTMFAVELRRIEGTTQAAPMNKQKFQHPPNFSTS